MARAARRRPRRRARQRRRPRARPLPRQQRGVGAGCGRERDEGLRDLRRRCSRSLPLGRGLLLVRRVHRHADAARGRAARRLLRPLGDARLVGLRQARTARQVRVPAAHAPLGAAAVVAGRACERVRHVGGGGAPQGRRSREQEEGLARHAAVAAAAVVPRPLPGGVAARAEGGQGLRRGESCAQAAARAERRRRRTAHPGAPRRRLRASLVDCAQLPWLGPLPEQLEPRSTERRGGRLRRAGRHRARRPLARGGDEAPPVRGAAQLRGHRARQRLGRQRVDGRRRRSAGAVRADARGGALPLPRVGPHGPRRRVGLQVRLDVLDGRVTLPPRRLLRQLQRHHRRAHDL
mmetsp:Transcript_32030/g.74656  ORF Transcript_32030/g.74656 Transcript_32030/m.74656 type:complete len:349 (-) Transcript_32030:69-1115(-)